MIVSFVLYLTVFIFTSYNWRRFIRCFSRIRTNMKWVLPFISFSVLAHFVACYVEKVKAPPLLLHSVFYLIFYMQTFYYPFFQLGLSSFFLPWILAFVHFNCCNECHISSLRPSSPASLRFHCCRHSRCGKCIKLISWALCGKVPWKSCRY